MRLFIVVLSILIIGALFIISNGNLHLKKEREAKIFFDSYIVWLAKGILEVKSFTLYAIKLDWLPSNDKNNQTLEIIGNAK
ncbi:MAG: hypothetical protein AABW75_01850 [Nanoarchaeota archaeon]